MNVINILNEEEIKRKTEISILKDLGLNPPWKIPSGYTDKAIKVRKKIIEEYSQIKNKIQKKTHKFENDDEKAGLKAYLKIIKPYYLKSIEHSFKKAKKDVSVWRRETDESLSRSKRESNEKQINIIINKYMVDAGHNDIFTLDSKGTKIDKKNILKLKRDQKITFDKVPYRFESKKGNLSSLYNNKGLLFAEFDKKLSNNNKKEIWSDLKLIKIAKDHNIKMEEAYTEEILKDINKKMTLETTENFPYLLVGGTTEKDIFVINPNQYWLEAALINFAGVFRIGIYAKSKTDKAKFPNILEFLKKKYPKALKEENFINFIKEILNG